MLRNPTGIQPERLEIKWMPAPPGKVKKSQAWKWETLLSPVKAAPGSTAQIWVHDTKIRGDAQVRRIKERLRKVAPYEKWEVLCRQQVHRDFDTDKIITEFGIYVTYKGVMTEKERLRKDELRRLRSERQKARIRRAKARKIPNIEEYTRASQPNTRRR